MSGSTGEGQTPSTPAPDPSTPSKGPDPTPSAAEPLDLMAGFILEDGRTWGAAACPWQLADAAEVLDPTGPRRSFRLAGRGMSKTSDTAAEALALMATEAPAHSRSYVFATDADQAAIFADAAAGWIERTPGLAALFDVGARTITARASGATLSIESSDGASAYGLRPWLTVADELPMWPATANHRRLWAAIASGVAKVPGARLVVTGTGGPPVGLGADVWKLAREHPEHWRTITRPGPPPWWSPEDVAATRASLTPAEWARLIRCQFAEGDDNLTDPGAVAAAIRPGESVLAYSSAAGPYLVTLDVGTRRDYSAAAVSHTEHRASGRVIVVDRVVIWQPPSGPGGRVDLAEVQESVERLAREYHAPVWADRMQSEQMIGNLTRSGIICHEYVFSSAGANRLARGLFIALRDRALSIPDDAELIAELKTARMVERGPGVVKLENPTGTHDDAATVVGMAVAVLTARPDAVGSISVPSLDRLPVALAKPARTRSVVDVARTQHHRTPSPGPSLGGPSPSRVRHALAGLRGGPTGPLGPEGRNRP